jgi:hypothetical protein
MSMFRWDSGVPGGMAAEREACLLVPTVEVVCVRMLVAGMRDHP